MKPVIWRSKARRDTEEAAWWYATQSGRPEAERFLSAVEAGISHVSRFPASGSLRHAALLGLDGLRFWPLRGYPYLIFYLELDTHLDIWRVLHAQTDIPEGMGEPRKIK